MSFSAAELVATIQLGGVSTAERDLERFRGNLDKTDSAAAKISKTADATFRSAATSIGVAATAAAAFTTKLFATGVAYNQLQQTSRAALRTLLGGAEAANAQMDKLDAFAKTSPFSKSTFISAQQQLIGFGFEASKVIPILNAVQNATAAVGGSNQQIGEIVSILAKIRSSGKIAAEDLNMLGERGLDAATLLGQGFGKSASDIRTEITKGTLDAGQAIDVLVAQMDAKFAGAASNVKDTFAGTTDRIKAASRDIGAALAEPFVSKNGGGLFVTWGNQVADVMRAAEKHVAPVVSILTNRAAPAFAEITALLDRAKVVVKSWDSARLESGLNMIGAYGPAVAATAGAVLGVNTQLLASIPVVGRFIPSFSPLVGLIAGAAAASPELRAQLGALLGTMQPLIPVTVDLAKTLSGGLNAALPIVATGIKGVVSVAKPLVDVISQVPAPVIGATIAAIGMYSAMKSGMPALQGFADGLKRIGEHVAVQAALASMEGNTSRLAGTFGAAGAAATGLGNSIKAAFVSNPVGIVLLAVSTAAGILTAAFAAQAQQTQITRDRIAAYKDTLNQASGAITNLTRSQVEKNLADTDARALAKELKVSYADFVSAILGEKDALDRVNKAIDENGKKRREGDNVAIGSTQAALKLRDILRQQTSDISAAGEQVRDYAAEQQKAAAAMTETGRSNERMNAALAIARDVSHDATERLKGLKQALDELNGGTKSQADLTRDLNEQTDRLRDVFLAADEAGNKLAPGLVNAAGAIDTTSAAGRGLYDEVSRLNDQMLDAILLADKDAKARGEQGIAVDQARQIAAKYQDTLRGLGAEAGLSDEQINGLISTMLATPEVVAYAVDDGGTVDAGKLRLIDLATQIRDTPNGHFEVTEDSIPGLQDALRLLGVDITTLPAGIVSVRKDDGSFMSAEESLAYLARPRTARIIVQPDGSFNIAGTNIRGFATGGPVTGPGTTTSDSITARLSNDEHVWTADEVHGAGGHGNVMAIRRAARAGRLGDLIPGFADGGPVVMIRSDRLPEQRVMTSTVSVPSTPGRATSTATEPRVDARVEFTGDFYGFDPRDVGREASEQLERILDAYGI